MKSGTESHSFIFSSNDIGWGNVIVIGCEVKKTVSDKLQHLFKSDRR